MSDKAKEQKQNNTELSFQKITVKCACGAKYEIGTTATKDIDIALCSKCHPFYTGEQKIVDSANLVAKYEERAKKAKSEVISRKEKKKQKREARSKLDSSTVQSNKDLTLKDIMQALKKGK